MSEKLFTLSKRDLDVALFASTDETRPMICHVHVSKKDGNVVLKATDAYVAIVLNINAIDMPDFAPFIIPASTLKLAKKVMGQRTQTVRKIGFRVKQYRVVDVADVYTDRIEIPTLDMVLKYEPLGESDASKYPDIDKLIAGIDNKNANTTVKLNSKLLERVIKFVSSDPIGSGGHGCDVKINGKYDPVKITNGNSYGLVMPIKS